MTQPRLFPLDDAARNLRRDAPAPEIATTTVPPRRTWPVLARIGDVASGEEREAKSEIKAPVAARRTYRIDTPHVTTANAPPASSLQRTGKIQPDKPSKELPPRSNRYLHRLPGVIRFAIRTWLMLHPYRSLIRTAAMFVVMAVSGASTVIMMGGHLRPDSAPPSTTSAATEQPVPAEATATPTALGPTIEPMAPPESSTTSLAPTALGPTGVERRELAAIEPAVTATEEIAPAPAVSSYYPITPYPAVPSLTTGGAALPRVETSDLPQAVARFEGTIERTSPR